MRRLFYMFLAVILTGCTTIQVRKTLDDVETYIADRPDSALFIIESIDTTDLNTRGLRAHHALLHAMALDKNYIDVTDDSLALKAVNYYQKRGSRKNYARSLYYLGLSYYYDKQYDKSIIELAKAEPVAAVADSLYLGFTKVLQADIYSINYNELAELEALKQALNIYVSLNEDYYVNVAKRRLAVSYTNNNMYAEAQLQLDELFNSHNLNKRIEIKAVGDYAFLKANQPNADYYAASKYFEKVAFEEDGKYMTRQDYWVWAYALSEIGDYDRCHEIVDAMKQIDSSGTAYHFMYMIAKNEGKNIEALEYLEKFSDKNNDEVVKILQQSISSIQRDFYQSQYEITGIKAKNRLLVIIIIVTAVAFLMVVVLVVTIRYRRRKEQEKEQYIRYAEEVNRQLKDFKQDTYSSLQKKYISMYKKKYETLGTLYDRYIQTEGRVDSEHFIYMDVVSLIDELRNEIGNREEFEEMLDKDLDGIMVKLRSELAGLKKKDYALFGYLALGFDATIISHFMDCTVNTVYIRKSRLKKAIEESEAEHKSLFMAIIS